MMNKVLILVLEFLLFCLIGFSASRYLLSKNAAQPVKEAKTAQEYTEAPAAQTVQKEAEAVPESVESATETLAVLNISQPVYNSHTQKYSFTVSATPDAQTFCLATDTGTPLKDFDRADGNFIVPAVESGKYLVYVMAGDHESKPVPVEGCEIRITKVSRGEFESLLNGKDATKAKADLQGRTVNKIQFVYTNLSEEDRSNNTPKHFMGIIDNVKLGVWNSVSVDKVSYDSSGHLNKATITIGY